MIRITAVLAALGAALMPLAAAAETLVDNVDGVTIGDDGGFLRFTGLVIDREGKVARLLQRGEKRPDRPDYLVDGEGRVLVPGFVDSHLRLMPLGLSTMLLDLSGTKTLAEAQARIAAHAAAHPDRPWIIGLNWDHEGWREAATGTARLPTATDLDAAVADRPAWLLGRDGQSGWANSKALAAAGITPATRNPPGGRIERLAGSQKPAGVLVGKAMDPVIRILPQPRPEDRDLALGAAQQLLLARGVTAVTDMGTTIEDWQAFRRAGDAGSLAIRIMAYAEGVEAMELIGGPGPSPWLYEDRLRLNGVALVADGAPETRGALLKAPYADDPANRGLAVQDGTQLRNLMSRAAIDRFQVAVSARGDAAVATVIDAIAELSQTYKGDRRWRIEQARIVDPADLPKLAGAGIIVSMQPARIASDRVVLPARLGAERLAGVQAWQSLARAGAGLAFGSGAPGELPDPFTALAAAISRQDSDGQPFGGWQPQERLPREVAWAAATAGAARAGQAEGRFGRLAPGQRADFLLLDRDPTLAAPVDLRQAKVLQTWIAGRLAWRRP